jgi:hypothetical protein
MPNPDIPQYNVFLSHAEPEAPLASRLRDDLPLANLTVYPDSVFSTESLAACEMIVLLQHGRKPADPLRAAMAAAQRAEQPMLTVYVNGDQLALRKIGRDPVYEDYGQGVVALVYAIWAVQGDERGQLVVENPLESGVDPLVWLEQLARENGSSKGELPKPEKPYQDET